MIKKYLMSHIRQGESIDAARNPERHDLSEM